MLDCLAHKVDRTTQKQYQTCHSRLSNLTHVVQDRAAVYGQRLDRLQQQWQHFDEQFEHARRLLHDLQQQCPTKMQQEDSVEQVRRKIWDNHAIQSRLNEEKPIMYQAVDSGRQLLKNVNCQALEADVTDFAENLLQLNNNTAAELKK